MASSLLLGEFQKKHKDILGVPYMPSWGKDSAIFKQVESVYGAEVSIKLINMYFAELLTDPFLQQTGASVGVFKSQIPKLLLKLKEQKGKESVGKW